MKKTWVKERIVHVALLAMAALVQLNGKWSDILAGDWEALKSLIVTVLMVTGFSAFQGVTSATLRREEKMEHLGRKHVSITCERSIVSNLWLGRAAFALMGLLLSGWVSVVSVLWDALVYPHWRKWYCKRNPYCGEDATREDAELEDLLGHLRDVAERQGFVIYNIAYRNAGWGVQFADSMDRISTHLYRPTLREAVTAELHRLNLKSIGRELASIARSAE